MNHRVAGSGESEKRGTSSSSSYPSEPNILESFLKDAESRMKTNPSNNNDDGDRLKKMLEKYESEVKQQQQQRAQVRAVTHVQQRPTVISHSQPCLIAIGTPTEPHNERAMSTSVYQRRSSNSSEQPIEHTTSLSQSRAVPNNQKMINSLREENIHLKRELGDIKSSLSKLQQIEFSYSRIEKEYEILFNEKKKQENLELAAISDLERAVDRITNERDELKSRLDKVFAEPSLVANIVFNELQQKHELEACKERQKLEIDAQNQTLNEQRNHIAMLEKALSNQQERLSKREKAYEDVSTMGKVVDDLKAKLAESIEEQNQKDKQYEADRAIWEMEKTQLRMQLNKDSSLSGSLKRSTATAEESLRMRIALQMKDDKIAQLESTITELRRVLAEEAENRKNSLHTVTIGFEAKIQNLKDELQEKDQKLLDLQTDRYERATEQEEKMRDMNRMEDLRQKIQERRKKGRMVAAGGLIGVDHTRSTSLQNNALIRTPSDSFDPPVPTQSSYTMIKGNQ